MQVAIIIGCFAIHSVASVVDTLKGATLSMILEETGFSYSLGGAIVTAFYFGYMTATLVTGVVSDRLGKRSAIYIASVAFGIGVIGTSGAESPASFLAFSFVNGVGSGATVLGDSRFMVSLRPKQAGLYLNLLGATFGFISMLTPFYVGFVQSLGGSWRDAYRYASVGAALCLIGFAWLRCPKDDADGGSGFGISELMEAVLAPEVRLFYLVILFFFAVEVGIGSWLIEYVVKAKGLSPETGAAHLSLYYGGFMGGRLAGALLVEKIGRVRILRLASLTALFCIAVGAFGPEWLTLLLPLSGLFFSVIFPTATACVSSLRTRNQGAVLGVLFAFIGVGGMPGPWLIGLVNDSLGVEWGIGLAAVFGFGLAASIYMAVRPRLGK